MREGEEVERVQARACTGASNYGLWRAGDVGVLAVPARQGGDHGEGTGACAS